jgi:hypothetical protein
MGVSLPFCLSLFLFNILFLCFYLDFIFPVPSVLQLLVSCSSLFLSFL